MKKLFLSEEYQLMNTKGKVELENQHFETSDKKGPRQWSLIDMKIISREKLMGNFIMKGSDMK